MTSTRSTGVTDNESADSRLASHEETFQARVDKLKKQIDKLEEFMFALTKIECPECQDSRCCDAHRPGGSEECTIIVELRSKFESLGQNNRRRAQNLKNVEKEVRNWIEALKVRNRKRLARLRALRDGTNIVSEQKNLYSGCIVS